MARFVRAERALFRAFRLGDRQADGLSAIPGPADRVEQRVNLDDHVVEYTFRSNAHIVPHVQREHEFGFPLERDRCLGQSGKDPVDAPLGFVGNQRWVEPEGLLDAVSSSVVPLTRP